VTPRTVFLEQTVGVYDCGCLRFCSRRLCLGVCKRCGTAADCYEGVVKSAEKAAATERELNEFLAHEVRNPLSSNVGLSFVTSAVNETAHISNEEFKKSLRGRRRHWLESSLH
jgi:hypothetical protein